MTLAMMVMMICSTIISQTSNSFSSGSRWARTKTKTFLECNGQNLFRPVEKNWKNQPLDHSTAEKIKENAIFWPFSQPWGKLTQIGLENSIGALLIGGCGARAVSRKTHIYFIYSCFYRVFKSTQFIGAFQAAKGVLTAGPRKAVKYAGAKLKKMFKSQMKKWALSKSQMKTFEMNGS